jgi:aspartate-semialdehyde dehydrogenase
MSAQSYRLGIVGATGAVGQELIRLLHERNFPLRELVLLASARSAGKQQTWNGRAWTIREATPDAFKDLDVAIFSAGGGTSEKLAPEAVKRGCVVIDNSSFFRMDPKVPLVVPDINAHALDAHQGIIANPNCSTAIALMGLQPLHRAFGLKGFFAATYQAVSGTGAQAIQELDAQVRAWADGRSSPPVVYPHPIAFNLIPQVDKFLDTGYTKEEMKMLHESKKILELPALRVTCTCVRVPVFRAHSIALSAEFERPVDLAQARDAIRGFVGAELHDDPARNIYPMPIEYSGKHRCGVGRLRRDTFFENGLSLWVSGDQLWRGAALNAVEIAEVLHQRGKLRVAK